MRLVAFAILCTSSAVAADSKLPAHYAVMFEKGRTWTYELSLTEFDYVERPDGTMRAVPGKPVISKFTCTVTGAVVFPEGAAANITCDKEIDSAYSFRVDGQWVATKAGIARGGAFELPTSAKELGAEPVVVAARPKVARTKTKDDFGGHVVRSITAPAKDTWCNVEDTTKTGAGDGAITTVCFKAGAGISSGTFDYHGGTPRIVAYKLAR